MVYTIIISKYTEKIKLSHGTTRESPLHVSSGSSIPETDPIEIDMEDVVG